MREKAQIKDSCAKRCLLRWEKVSRDATDEVAPYGSSVDTNIIPSHTLGKGYSTSAQNSSLTSNPRSRRHLRFVAPSGFDYGRYLPPLRMTLFITVAQIRPKDLSGR